MKVHELAKELGVTNDAIIRRCPELSISATHHMHELNDEAVDIIKAVINDEVKAKTTTKPWNASENPWSLDMLSLLKKRPGYRARWTTAAGLQRKLDQGWTLANRKDYGGAAAVLPGEESKDGTIIKRRELILVEMSEEMCEARSEFFRKKTDKRSVDARQIAKDQAAQIDGVNLQVSSTVA